MCLFDVTVDPNRFRYLVLDAAGREACTYCASLIINRKLVHREECPAVVVWRALSKEKKHVDSVESTAV